jgi:hypothetical protein
MQCGIIKHLLTGYVGNSKARLLLHLASPRDIVSVSENNRLATTLLPVNKYIHFYIDTCDSILYLCITFLKLFTS